MKQVADVAEIRRTLELLYPPGPWRDFCVELRAPGTAKGTVAGYFADPERLAVWAAQLSGGFRVGRRGIMKVAAVYDTLNPVSAALLARCANRCELYAKATAGDADVLYRRWLGLDFDPVRPSGVSSTAAEHAAALETAKGVREWLKDLGWPEPVLAIQETAHICCICQGKGWTDLRDLLEPGWSEKEKAPEESKLAWLSSPVAVPEGWDRSVAVVTTDWKVARRVYAEGKAVVVLGRDLSAPRGAGAVLREAAEVEVVAEGEERRRLEWELFPLLVAKRRAGTYTYVEEMNGQQDGVGSEDAPGPIHEEEVEEKKESTPGAEEIVHELVTRYGI